LSKEAILVVWIWRSFLVLTAVHPVTYSRPILSFKTSPSYSRVEFDASLTGLAIVSSSVQNHTLSIYRVASADTPDSLKSNSGYQNSMEFIAMLFAICLIYSLGNSDTGVDFIGDSNSALSW